MPQTDEMTRTHSWPLYRGTKELKAKPMTKAEYCGLRNWRVPADEDPNERGYVVEYQDGGKPNLEGYDGYVSWSPADVFERAYFTVAAGALPPPFGFSEAVKRLIAGESVSRLGWNGTGMFLYYVPEGQYPARTKVARDHFGEDALVPYRAYIAMKTAQGDVVPWVASQSDILAFDWLVGPNPKP